MIELDEIDRKLLAALARDATQSASALGRRFGLSQPAAWRRIRRLQEGGAIRGRRLHATTTLAPIAIIPRLRSMGSVIGPSMKTPSSGWRNCSVVMRSTP